MIKHLTILAAAVVPAFAMGGEYQAKVIDIGGGRYAYVTVKTPAASEQSPYALQGREQRPSEQKGERTAPQPEARWAGPHFIGVTPK